MSKRSSAFGLFLFPLLVFSSGPVHALVGMDTSINSRSSNPGFILDIGSVQLSGPRALGLTDDKTLNRSQSLNESVQSELMRRRLMPAMLKVRSTSTQPGLNLQDDQESMTSELYYNGIPVCDASVRAVRMRNGSVSVMTTQLPGAQTIAPLSSEFPAVEDVRGFLIEHATEKDELLGDRLRILNRCWVVSDGELKPALSVSFVMNKLPYRGVATSDRLHLVEPQYFSAVGKTIVYPQNPTDAERSIFSIGDLTGNGKLESTAFTTVTNGVKTAQQCDHVFAYDPEDERYAEVASFTNTTRALSWFTSFLGYKWTDEPLTIRIHEEIGSPPNEKNNALYQPPSATDDKRPNILIGDGDGIQLQNLALDQDVVSHEFGHHIVYRTLKSTARESLVLHEGLADFFTYARTDNACLGESICPEGSQFCWKTSCLRTAENDLKFTDLNLPAQAHLRSQFISGMLWDLKIKHSISIGDVARIVYKATDFFSAEMVYEQFISALIQADSELFEGANCTAILTAATDRGLAARIDDLTCDGAGVTERLGADLKLDDAAAAADTKYILKVSDKVEDALATTSLCVSMPRAPGALLTPCGVVGHDGYAPRNSWALLLLAAPLFLAGWFSLARRASSKS